MTGLGSMPVYFFFAKRSGLEILGGLDLPCLDRLLTDCLLNWFVELFVFTSSSLLVST